MAPLPWIYHSQNVKLVFLWEPDAIMRSLVSPSPSPACDLFGLTFESPALSEGMTHIDI